MTDFRNCTGCAGEGYRENGETCPICCGGGERPLTAENFALAYTSREWVDEKIDRLLAEWSKIAPIDIGYGMEEWDLSGDQIRITIDTSCKGCRSTETVSIPLAWLLSQPSERERLMAEEATALRNAKALREERERQRQLDAARATIARLEKKTA